MHISRPRNKKKLKNQNKDKLADFEGGMTVCKGKGLVYEAAGFKC